jgi:DNA (cytosine-5)-methyltransferase 1
VARAERAIGVLGRGVPFLIVYYGTDGSGGWQPLDRPIRTLTTLDRFALVDWFDGEPRMRMLQVDELQRAMGFDEGFILDQGSRRDRIKLLGNGVCPPVMRRIVESLIDGTKVVDKPPPRGVPADRGDQDSRNPPAVAA